MLFQIRVACRCGFKHEMPFGKCKTVSPGVRAVMRPMDGEPNKPPRNVNAMTIDEASRAISLGF